jgi:hypothetical protein
MYASAYVSIAPVSLALNAGANAVYPAGQTIQVHRTK